MRKVAFVLTPAASKRLIAKGVAALPEVQYALKHGKIIVAGGTTNAYIAEELSGRTIEKCRYTAGIVIDSAWGVTPADGRITPLVLDKGEVSTRPWLEVLGEFARGDVFVKGGNALDPEGIVGVLVSAKNGGTIGTAFGQIVSLGAHLIIPIGLEKLIPSVIDAANTLGQLEIDECSGLPCGLFPVVYGTVITEIEAIQALYGLEAVHVHSGGVGGSEGAVGLVAFGDSNATRHLMQDIETLKNEPPTVR
ncbi:MAG: hypothetical protein DDT36_00972 [Firmicutes bacterium]|nr:hypothetical protein [Bacillota bacterium]